MTRTNWKQHFEQAIITRDRYRASLATARYRVAELRKQTEDQERRIEELEREVRILKRDLEERPNELYRAANCLRFMIAGTRHLPWDHQVYFNPSPDDPSQRARTSLGNLRRLMEVIDGRIDELEDELEDADQ